MCVWGGKRKEGRKEKEKEVVCTGLSHTIAHRCIKTSALQSTHAHTCRSSRPSLPALSPDSLSFRMRRPHFCV